jgi:hypothetical protein
MSLHLKIQMVCGHSAWQVGYVPHSAWVAEAARGITPAVSDEGTSSLLVASSIRALDAIACLCYVVHPADALQIAMIYEKSLRVTNAVKSEMGVGAIVNLQSNDASKIWNTPLYMHIIWNGPFQVRENDKVMLSSEQQRCYDTRDLAAKAY